MSGFVENFVLLCRHNKRGKENMSTQENNSKKRNIVLSVIAILLTISIIIGISYAYWVARVTQSSSNIVNSDCLNLTLTDQNPITLEKAYPLSDSEAQELTPYTFTVTNTCNLSVTYDVTLEIMDETDRLASKYIALQVDDEAKRLLSRYSEVTPTYKDETYTAVEARGIKTGTLAGGESITYSIRLWMDESVTSEDSMNKFFTSKISINAAFNQVAYTDSILNGADPVITGDLIPVTITDDGTVNKANTQSAWYSYEDKEWANAVILKDNTVTYSDYEVIPEDNIESYFVWIPKYSYQLWDLGEYTSATTISSWSDITIGSDKQDTINIKFGTTNTSDEKDNECTTPLVSGESGNCQVGDWMTHPAFINANTNGLWVGKFETGYDGATTTEEAEVSSQDSIKIIVKPNVYSWRSNTVYNFFMASYNYNRNLDSHMMKNTEWGAVSYLSYSKYGLNDEIWINNNSNYVTGCVGNSVSAGSVSTCQNTYNTTTGYKGNTTGNITGIYDMSGGAWEYMAAYGANATGLSGFSSTALSTYADYLDVYDAASDLNTYNFRILGDATGEMGPFYYVSNNYYNNWFQDYSRFVNSSSPWFARSGGYSSGSATGWFGHGRDTGSAISLIGTRLVLAI
jgi:hypothetical protein